MRPSQTTIPAREGLKEPEVGSMASKSAVCDKLLYDPFNKRTSQLAFQAKHL
jgi:hypothetical protein